ncbi:MAG: cytochrome c maturation protein CcmE [Planctomycetota bacterium]
MKTKTLIKIVVGLVLIGGSMAYFIYQTMQSSWAYYYSVDDLGANKAAAQDHSLRIAGSVKKGSVQKDLQKMRLTFVLTGSQAALPVSYEGVVPDNFDEDIEVVVEGYLGTTGVFQADKLMTRCESKYRAKVK